MQLLANFDGGTLWPLLLAVLVTSCVYLVPSVMAASRRHRHIGPIIALNIFLGWTIIGWMIAFGWALMNSARKPQERVAR